MPEVLEARWRKIWDDYKAAKAPPAPSTAKKTQREMARAKAEAEVDAMVAEPSPAAKSFESERSGAKQPGSKRRLSGYHHHVPSADSHLPNAVAKDRLKAMLDAVREGRKYSEDDRRKSRIRTAREVN